MLALAASAALQPASAQELSASAYGLNVGTWIGDSPIQDGGIADFQRLRGMAAWSPDPLTLEIAYEHTLLFRQDGASGAQLFTAGGTASGGDWLDLDGTIEETGRLLWRHRVDRLNASIRLGERAEVTVGRQPVSWATTLIFTPADPFSPFDPSDPFREYRPGVDALRLQVYPGPLSSVDVVVRRSDFERESTTTALVRGSWSVAGWDLSAWAGSLHDRTAGAVGIVRTVRGWALRGEVSARELGGDHRANGTTGGTVWRATAGADRFFTVAARDLYLIVEYQRDGFGATRALDLIGAAATEAFNRGEVQALGRDEGAAQASWQLHPLVSVDLLVLANLRDGSLLYAPGVSWSATGAVSVRAGAFFASGAGLDPVTGLQSEYGEVPGIGYLSGSWFF